MVAPVTFAKRYVRPTSAEEALALSLAGGATLVAGGTDIARRPRPWAETLVDLGGAGLDALELRDGVLRIWAMTTLTDLAHHPFVATVGGGFMAHMLRRVGSPLLRNIATLGGHVARGRLSDIVPVLLVLDARIRFYDGQHVELRLGDYFAERRHQTAHVVTELLVPEDQDARGWFVKFSRTSFDLAMLNCACLVSGAGGEISGARVAVGETPALATRLVEVEGELLDTGLSDEAIESAARVAARTAMVRTDLRASARYRRHLAYVAVRRALLGIRETA